MTEPSKRIPIAYVIRIGEAVLDMVLAGDPCPVCKQATGAHAVDCFVGAAIINDPSVARRARAARERNSR